MDAPGPAPIKGRVRRMSARPEVQPLEAAPAPRERRSSAAVLAESALRAEVLQFLWFSLSVKQSCVMAGRPLKEEITSQTAKSVQFLLAESSSVRERQITRMQQRDVMLNVEKTQHWQYGSPESKTAQPDDEDDSDEFDDGS